MAVVRNRVSAGRGKAVSVHQPKTRRGRRNVALDVTSVEVLRSHRTAQLAERLRLGHATVGITLDLYSHVLDGMQAEAAEQIGVVVFGQRADKRVVGGGEALPTRCSPTFDVCEFDR